MTSEINPIDSLSLEELRAAYREQEHKALITYKAFRKQATELSQLRAERDGLLKWVDKEIAACLPGLPNHRLEDLQDFKSHLTRTEQSEDSELGGQILTATRNLS